MENSDKIIVLVIALVASFATWKMVFDFYTNKFHRVFVHVVSIMTASFMFISSMLLFAPKNYQRGITPEVEISFMGIMSIVVMLLTLYLFFKYIPSKK